MTTAKGCWLRARHADLRGKPAQDGQASRLSFFTAPNILGVLIRRRRYFWPGKIKLARF
jgi:hypothetical protein